MNSVHGGRGRREFLRSALALTPLPALAALPMQLPEMGLVVHLQPGQDPSAALAQVTRLGLTQCQLFVGLAPVSAAASIRGAIRSSGVTVTAFMTLGEGPFAWNLKDGPATIGIVPRATRAARVRALKQASDLAHACGVTAVHTHCGFLPETAADPLYPESVAALHDVGLHCRQNGQTFLCETGQETPITLLRALNDSQLDNVAVNLDMANLILYGEGEPVGALDVLGSRVRGTHVKDGRYPTDPYGLGEETAIGHGDVRFDAVFRKLHALGYTGPLTIEREISGPQQEADIRQSIIYLQQQLKQAYAS